MGMLQGAPCPPTNGLQRFVTAGNLACCLGDQRPVWRSSVGGLILSCCFTAHERLWWKHAVCTILIHQWKHLFHIFKEELMVKVTNQEKVIIFNPERRRWMNRPNDLNKWSRYLVGYHRKCTSDVIGCQSPSQISNMFGGFFLLFFLNHIHHCLTSSRFRDEKVTV